MRYRHCLACLAAAVFIASPALAGLPTVIFSNIVASPTSDVPGMPGVKFNAGTGTQFDKPFRSPDGQRWILGAVIESAVTTNDEIIVIGSGTDGTTASVPIQEGSPTFFDGAVNYGIFDSPAYLGINDAGSYAFSVDTSAPTTTDEIVARWTVGGGFELMAREGTQAVGQGAGIGYGSASDAARITNNDIVMFRSASLTGATTQQVLFRNTSIAAGAVLAQTDTTVLANQLVAPDQSIDTLSLNRFDADSTGANYIVHGDLNGPTTTDLFMAVNGAVVAQEGAPLPGGYFPGFNVILLSAGAGSQQVSPANGHYAYRGNINDGAGAAATDFVIVDGVLAAATDQPIVPGSVELYDDAIFTTCFFMNAVNSCGDYVIGGVTTAADLNANAVLVLNGKMRVLRENDPVDVNGNGLADDDAFISVFNDDDSFLTDDRKYYFHADLRNAALASIGQALLWVQLPQLGDMNCDMSLDFFDIDGFLLALFDEPGYNAAFPDCDRRNADVNKDGSVDFFDIDAFLDALFGP